MRQTILLSICLMLCNLVISQTEIAHSVHLLAKTTTIGAEGDLYICKDDNLIFIGLSNGSLHAIAQNLKEILEQGNDASLKQITNLSDAVNLQDAITKNDVDNNVNKNKNILTSSSNLTLTPSQHTVILGGIHDITTENIGVNKGKAYYIKNLNLNNTSISDFTNNRNINTTNYIKKNSNLIIQSDGVYWQQINNYSKSTLTKESENIFSFNNNINSAVRFKAENVKTDYPSVLPGMIARFRADYKYTIIDDSDVTFGADGKANGKNGNHVDFNNTIFQWRDISERDHDNDAATPRVKNNNHLTATVISPPSNQSLYIDSEGIASYIPNNITTPEYRNNAMVKGVGKVEDITESHLRVDLSPDLNESFTFVFVMRAVNPTATKYGSFIASADGHSGSSTTPKGANSVGSWQISTTLENTPLYFRYHDGSDTEDIELHNYDTNIHAYYIEYNNLNRNLKIYVDGNLVSDTVIATDKQSPIIRDLRLFKNRNSETYLEAEFHEFFLADTVFSVGQKQLLIEYILAKWGVNL